LQARLGFLLLLQTFFEQVQDLGMIGRLITEVMFGIGSVSNDETVQAKTCDPRTQDWEQVLPA
jgi:hypothetical protein